MLGRSNRGEDTEDVFCMGFALLKGAPVFQNCSFQSFSHSVVFSASKTVSVDIWGGS